MSSARLRIAYYTRPAFLDQTLLLTRELTRFADVHVLLELSPEERPAGALGESLIGARQGLRTAAGALRDGFLAEARPFVANLAGFDFVVHSNRRAYAPASLGVAAAAAWHIGKLRPDILQFEDLTPRSSPLLFLLPRIPRVVAIHDAHTHLGDRVGRAERIRRVSAARANRLVFYSRFSQAQYLADGPAPPSIAVHLGPNFVWAHWPGPAVAEREPTLLFFGRLSAYKGLDVLFAALPSIAARVPGLRIVIAGRPGPDFALPAVPALPNGAELSPRFEHIEPAILRRLFLEASVVVLPYVEASQSAVVQTAYAFGKPVVASAVGGLPEAIKDGITGRLVPPGDPTTLARVVSELLLDRPLRARMAEAIGRQEETESGWAATARHLSGLYAELVKQA